MSTVMSSLLVALWVGRALGAACSTASPIALPITDKVVDPTIPDSLMRGIPAKIGTPPQDIVVLPWPDINNTYIYDDQGYCDSSIIWNDEICEIRRGHLFQDDKSTSFSKATDLIAAGGATQELGDVRGAELGVSKLLSTSVGGTEQFTIAPANVTTMPIGIPRMRWDHGYTILHALGLGSNSTFLNSLIQTHQIPSRVWSIFWGRMWTGSKSTDMDGSLVLGGYDKEKVIGSNVTQALDYSEATGCWTGMKVTVSDLLVNFRNGSDFSVMPRNSAVQCCIVPQRQLVWEGPVNVVEAFVGATQMSITGQSFGLHWNALRLNTSFDIFDGDATFVLSNGLSIRVPNSQLITPAVDVDRNGSRTVDRSQRELLLSGVTDNPTTLGRYFFTAAYLMVDHDAHTFTMWQANPTIKTSLVPVISKKTDDGNCGSGSSSSGSQGGNSTGEGTGTTTSSSSSSVSAGAIAGAVVGAVAGVAAIAAAVVFFLRRKRKQQNGRYMLSSLPASPEGEGGYQATGGFVPGGQPPEYYKVDTPGIQEAPGREHGPRELHAESAPEPPGYHGGGAGMMTGPNVAYEMDGGGMPQDRSQGFSQPGQPWPGGYGGYR